MSLASSAKLLSPNAEIVGRLNSVILADRRLKCVHTRKPGAKSRNLHSELEPEVVFAAILAKNRKSGFFLTPVLPLPLAMQGRYWDRATLEHAETARARSRGEEGQRDATCCGETARCHVVQRDREMLKRAEGPRDATACRETARCHVVQRDRPVPHLPVRPLHKP